MSVQVSYKKQTLLGIIGLLMLFLAVEAIANVWWVTQISCEFEENEIFMNMNKKSKLQYYNQNFNKISQKYFLSLKCNFVILKEIRNYRITIRVLKR